MNTLRQQYLEQVKSAQRRQKTLVGKSAVGPQLVCLRNGHGQVIGFGEAEHVPPDEIKQMVSKSVNAVGTREIGGDILDCEIVESPDPENDVFDSLFMFDFQRMPGAVEVSKSAEDDPNADLVGLFPAFLQPR